MSLIIQSNIPMLNAQNKYKVNTSNKTKSTEKLSSGYRINKAADDAAGLQISEKMRWQIRGLEQGTRNGQDGVSWVQIGDGALGEIQEMLHRMKELTVQSLNDTNTPEDRAALQAEFDALQCEIDKVSDSTRFNTKNIFDEHKETYYQLEGNVNWYQNQRHVINTGDNELVITYKMDDASPEETVTLTVPAGEYTTQELTDELENAIGKSVAADKGLVVEYTDDGSFNVNLEGGQQILDVSGALSYLLYDVYEGGSVGALIGTTIFENDIAKLDISSQNNNLSFDIETFDGQKSHMNITLPTGRYNRPQIIELLNNQLAATPVKAVAQGTGIKLGSNEAIITGFKGNMFKIDEEDKGEKVYSSVFYDNVKYGSIYMTSGTFKGGAVMPDNVNDDEHRLFVMDSTNNQLTFTANGSTTSVTLTIPEGEYTMTQMVDKLNELFTQNNLELKAESYDGGAYKGIEIKSQIKGVTSQVGLDSSGSAYDTLFVNRVYNVYRTDAASGRETTADRSAIFTGSKAHSGTNVPLTITTGQNDKFTLNLDGDTYTITLDAGIYNTADEIKNQIDDKLNGSSALAGYNGIVDVSVYNNKIRLTAVSDKGITSLKAQAVAGNDGYDNIFVGKNAYTNHKVVSGSGTTSSPVSVTLNTQVTEPANIASGDNKLVIKVDGVDRTVTLPTGNNVTHAEIEKAIEDAIQGGPHTVYYKFDDINERGTDSTNHFTATGQSGKTNVSPKVYSEKGDSHTQQGTAGGYSYNIPAKVTMDVAIPDSMSLDSANNQLRITLNGDDRTILLDTRTYTRNELVSEIQKKIDAEYGIYEKGAKVSLDSSNRLIFESRLNDIDGVPIAGINTNISFSTSGSTFIKELHTTRTAGYVDAQNVQSTVKITDDSNIFTFSYNENGTNHPVSVVLDNGTYSSADFVKMLDKKIKDAGANINATLVGGKLRLTTNSVGDGNSVSYASKTGGTSVNAIFGERTTGTPAVGTANASLQDSIVIDDSSNGFNITINGTKHSVTLDNGTYTKSSFVSMLNSKLSGANVTAELVGSNIKYTTTTVGKTSSIYMTYSGGGSSMVAMYGKDAQELSGIDAEFTQDNKLMLTGTKNGGSISVDSRYGSIFQEPEITYSDISVSTQSGYKSTKTSYVDGVNITEPVKIDKWNNDLKFTYYENGTNRAVNISLAEKEYTFAELEQAIQSEIDTQTGGQGKIAVTVNASGVRLETQTPGSKYYINESNFSGDFYYKVMCSTYEKVVKQTPKVTNGTAPQDTAFTVGRKDVNNKDVEIKRDVNDTLALDFQYNGTTVKLSMTLDEGVYKGNSLVNMIQEKLNAQLVAKGLHEGTIEVGIGGVNTGVVGANDNNALKFQLSRTVPLPSEGTYIIDGVSGNAAFSVFYQTDGELIPAYVKGAKDITGGVIIDAGNNQLTFDVDGMNYSLTIPEGEYTSDEILDVINDQLTAANAPVAAEIDGKNLKISYNKLGEHKISNVGGSAKKELFYQENGRIANPENVKIQLSSNVGDYIEIDKPKLSTAFLNINSVVITRPKYANKALERVDKALEKVSEIRSSFGAEQNRIEYALNNNENKAENTQAAESRIRDVDMAEEMVEYSKHNILQNTAQAMMAQINSNADNVIKLLQM